MRKLTPLLSGLALFLLLAFPACERQNTSPGKSKNQENIQITQEDRNQRAKELLAEAGFEDPGEDFPEMTVLYNTDKMHEQIAIAIQNMWRENLGINVQLKNTEWKTYLNKRNNKDYQICRAGWIGDYNDPYTFLEMFREGGGNNDTGWGSKKYEELLDKTKRAGSKKKRYRYMEQAEHILMDEVPIVPIYFYVTQELVKPEVKGWYQTIRARHPLRAAHRTDDRPLVIHLSSGIQSLDPPMAEGVYGHRVQNGLFEGLTRYDPKTLEPKPGVARSWDVSDDGKTYTFHLREEARWSDGEPVTAHDFEYAWKRVLNPETGSQYAHILYPLKGAEKYHKGKTANAGVVGVNATDDRTLEVTLSHPTPYFLNLTAFATYYPVRKDVVEQHGKQWTRPEHFVGNGAFTVRERSVNNHIILEKNEAFREADDVKQDVIKFEIVANTTTAFNMYEKDKIHVMTSIPTQNRNRILKRDDFHSGPYLGTYYYAFNTEAEPLDKPAVRKALGLAINRNVIVNKITRAGETPAYHYVPPLFDGFNHPRFDKLAMPGERLPDRTEE